METSPRAPQAAAARPALASVIGLLLFGVVSWAGCLAHWRLTTVLGVYAGLYVLTTLGVGIGANVTEHWNVRFDYQFFATDRDGLGLSGGDDPTIDTLPVGVHYRFGRAER